MNDTNYSLGIIPIQTVIREITQALAPAISNSYQLTQKHQDS